MVYDTGFFFVMRVLRWCDTKWDPNEVHQFCDWLKICSNRKISKGPVIILEYVKNHK